MSPEEIPWWLEYGLATASISLVGILFTNAWSKSAARRDRLRDTYSKALSAAVEYAEFPYIVRRRRADEPAAERVRISTAMSDVQKRIAFYEAWTGTESRAVAESYRTLVKETRKAAGRSVHDAWLEPPTDSDDKMNISPDIVDLSELVPARDVFVEAARDHVSWWPAWLRRRTRRIFTKK